MAATGVIALALAYPSVGHAQVAQDVVRYEAESSPATCDGWLESEHAGYSGGGYCNTENSSGAAAEFTIEGATADQAVLEFGFANGSGNARSANVLVNGVFASSVAFEPSGAWTDWSTESVTVELNQGTNTIRLAATGSAGLPNIDYMDASSGGQSGTPTVEPSVVSSFDTSAAGGGARPLIGDVSGDGRLDLVMMQPHAIADDRYEGALVAALTAYDIEGNRLWQAGQVDPNGANQGSDIPAQIHDIDGDGLNEVVAIMHPNGNTSTEGRFYVFDGQTGQLERDFALPDPQAHDAIVFANLSGSAGSPPEILLKDRYSRAWAIDNNGQLLWSHQGNTGHYPWPYDFDGDGLEEIMIGYDMVDSDGDILWTYNSDGHADTMWMADLTGDGQVEVVLGGDAAIAFDASTGQQIWRQDGIVETQNIMVGDFIPELEGLESLGLDRIDRSAQGYDGLFLLDENGEFVWQEERETRGCWGTIPEPIHNWAGDGGDLIMSWNRGCGEPTTIMNGNGDVISELDSAARLWHADFCGDDKEEVVEYIQGVSLTIKSNGECDIDAKITGEPRPQTKRQYNNTRYTAGETPA
ncbi:hypothetical protein GCM10029992_51410 [Glycomyces albus]